MQEPLLPLDEIGLRFKTDKASSGHDYLSFYEQYFAPLRKRNLTILEIGVLGAASLKTWEAYFPNATIIGADINVACRRFEGNRVKIRIIDQSNLEHLVRLAMEHGPFDIIIEDGSHMWEHQITTLRTLFPFLKAEGLYIAEDLQTNFGEMVEAYRGIASISCVEYLKKWLDLRVGDDKIPIAKEEDAFLRTYGRAVHFITFYRRACIIKKQTIKGQIEDSAGEPLVPPAASTVQYQVVAHVSHVGDIYGGDGFVNPGADRFAFQSISISSQDVAFEYRVRGQDSRWGPWIRNNATAGIKGQSKLITGVTVRLPAALKDRYRLRSFGRFVGAPAIIEAADGEDCLSPAGRPLCAFQIELTDRGT